MKTFILYTISQKVTVKNCKDLDHALSKADLTQDEIFKSEEK